MVARWWEVGAHSGTARACHPCTRRYALAPVSAAESQHDVAVFHPGVQHSWQTALALQQLGRLNVYATSIFYRPDRWPYRIERYLPAPLAARVHAEFRRFAGPPLESQRVEAFGAVEWLERVAGRLGARRLSGRLDQLGNRLFAHGLARTIGARRPDILWGYNGSALETFADPRNAHRLRVLDRTIADCRAYNAALHAIRPRYGAFFPAGWRPVPQARIDRDDAEYDYADLILTGSPHASDTIATGTGDRALPAKLRVLPYCFDEALFGALPPPVPAPHDAPVRFLFLGQAHVRKGIHLALEAIARIPRSAATLTIVGLLDVPDGAFAPYADRVTYRPTVPRGDVPALMADADVLLFPSYFEGSALSLIEALAAGLAIIQSPAAGLGATPATGLMLPALTTDAVYTAMMTVIEDRPRLSAMRAAAQGEARRYTFARYREGIAALLAEGHA